MRQSIVLIFVIGAAAAAFGWGSVVASYPAPVARVTGLGAIKYNNVDYITLGAAQGAPAVWVLYETTGSLERSFVITQNVGAHYPMGMCAGYVGGVPQVWVVLYCGSTYTDYIFRCNYVTGSVLGYYPTPINVEAPAGAGLSLQTDGPIPYLYFNFGQNFYVLNPLTGSVYGSFPEALGTWDTDYGAGYLWCASAGLPPYPLIIEKRTTTGSLVDRFWHMFPTQLWGPGCAYDPVGPYVWASDDPYGGNGTLYVFELSPSTALTPASLGRVKAIFR